MQFENNDKSSISSYGGKLKILWKRTKLDDGAPDGQESFKIGLANYTQYRRVTDRQTPHDGIDRSAERRAGKNVNEMSQSVARVSH